MSKKVRHLIFLMGYAGAGKDTVAQMIKDLSYGKSDIIGFADALKKEYYATVGYEYERGKEDRDFKEQHRPGIIRYGEGMKHEKGIYHWIETALDPLLFDKESENNIIVPDCRRVEEVLWMKRFMQKRHAKYMAVYENFDPHLFLIYRPEYHLKDRDYLTHLAVDIAAEEMFMVNRLIKNTKDLNHLKVIVEELYACRLK